MLDEQVVVDTPARTEQPTADSIDTTNDGTPRTTTMDVVFSSVFSSYIAATTATATISSAERVRCFTGSRSIYSNSKAAGMRKCNWSLVGWLKKCRRYSRADVELPAA